MKEKLKTAFMNLFVSSFMNFYDRVKAKNMRKNEQFWITFAITYIVTIFFTMSVVFKQYEDVMISTNYSGGILQFLNTTTYKFTFGYCAGLDAWTYLASKIMETSIPTTITFAGVILVLQTARENTTLLNMGLFVTLLIFTIAGIFFMVCRIENILIFYIRILTILFCIVVAFSAKLFKINNNNDNLHKTEESDGNISR